MHHIGDINERVWNSKVGPLYTKLVAEASGKTGNDKKVDVDAVMASEPTLSNTLNEKNNQSTAITQGGD
jgi:cytochrome c biogenesis protein CcmG/thiol:disulfide interchange protein DsbE